MKGQSCLQTHGGVQSGKKTGSRHEGWARKRAAIEGGRPGGGRERNALRSTQPSDAGLLPNWPERLEPWQHQPLPQLLLAAPLCQISGA